MFAEDVALIPKGAFSELLKSLKEAPEQFAPMVGELWRAMDKGEFSIAIRAALPRFNGKLFKSPEAGSLVLPVTKQHIQLLIEAAKPDWREVEPAIFGTLLEQRAGSRRSAARPRRAFHPARLCRAPRAGHRHRAAAQGMEQRAGRRRATRQRRGATKKPSPSCAIFITACAPCACSTQLAAVAISSTSRSNT
jgi:hypothetical protein